MDNLAHSLVGLTAAKAGLERLSPGATTVCVLAANASDIDIVSLLVGGRWSFLQHHRGITHSIGSTLVLALLLSTGFWLGERVLARLWRQPARTRCRGLLLAALIAAATHPLMDWTNNYGIRLLLPWSSKWFYGDLVFIVDPYFWLIIGAAAFLLTSDRTVKLLAWVALAAVTTLLVLMTPAGRVGMLNPLMVRGIWLGGILVLATARGLRVGSRFGRAIAWASFGGLFIYCGTLAWAHSRAYGRALARATELASAQHEQVVQAAAMPTLGDPFRWQCVVETDQAIYRFFVDLGDRRPAADNSSVVPHASQNDWFDPEIKRFQKAANPEQQLVALASRDPRAQILLNFSRFPLARAMDANCTGQTIVQFADLRYTEPGAAARTAFALEVPVACPPR